ncbi:hypothetical protein MKEN_00384000 [Mycena kentingensis (nom. inval.)]|nr:hypothetical protein MKEN_00384000 [Mycena kentingensis (nom. inval.)]
MSLARQQDLLDPLTCPELAIALRQPQSIAAPGRVLGSFYQRSGNWLERNVNRLAHCLGKGPLVVQERIEELLEKGPRQESTLQALRSGQSVPPKFRKYCTELLRFALPSESACTQIDCFGIIVSLSTQYPGMRRVFLDALQLGRRETLTRDAILSVWRRGDTFGSLQDFCFASTFAAECITDTCVSAFVETVQPPWLIDTRVAASALTTVERLIGASGSLSAASSEFFPLLAIHYLAGVVACPSFWRQEGSLFAGVVLKLLRATTELIRDSGVEEVEGPVRPQALDATEGIDLLCHSILVGVQDREASKVPILVLSPDFSQLVSLARYPRAAEILPLSWKLSNSSGFQATVPCTFTFRSVETLLLETPFSPPSAFRRVMHTIQRQRRRLAGASTQDFSPSHNTQNPRYFDFLVPDDDAKQETASAPRRKWRRYTVASNASSEDVTGGESTDADSSSSLPSSDSVVEEQTEFDSGRRDSDASSLTTAGESSAAPVPPSLPQTRATSGPTPSQCHPPLDLPSRDSIGDQASLDAERRGSVASLLPMINESSNAPVPRFLRKTPAGVGDFAGKWEDHPQAQAILGNLIGPNREQLTTPEDGAVVFVDRLSPLVGEDTLKSFFVPFGEIQSVKVLDGKHCGFVDFLHKADAENAIQKMQGFPVGGSRIRLSWSRRHKIIDSDASAQSDWLEDVVWSVDSDFPSVDLETPSETPLDPAFSHLEVLSTSGSWVNGASWISAAARAAASNSPPLAQANQPRPTKLDWGSTGT